MKLGAEPKKVAILVGLVLVAAYFFLGDSGTTPPPRPRATTQAKVEPQVPQRRSAPRARPRAGSRRSGQTFRPSLLPPRPEDRPDPSKVDPTLRLDLLARLQNVEMNGVKRSLFEFGAAPPPETKEPTIDTAALEKIKEAQRKAAEKRAAAKKNTKPPPPPINLKFYGFIRSVRADGKRAFFLEGEDIFVAGEGDTIKKRYKVIRIGVNSAVVEDTEHDHKQTLALVSEQRRG